MALSGGTVTGISAPTVHTEKNEREGIQNGINSFNNSYIIEYKRSTDERVAVSVDRRFRCALFDNRADVDLVAVRHTMVVLS
jgi:hypothetical protein